MENKRKKITNYSILMNKMLGQGACGKVYVGQQDNTKLKVAIKILEKKTVDKDYYLKSSLFSQIQILKSLKSPNIVGFLDVMESKNSYYIIQEFCDGGELRGLMKKRGKLPQKQAINLLKQICNGFVQLIKEGVMHRDLKPQNILIHKGVLKLADFGFSKKDRAKRMAAQTMVGTPLYMSIQILKGLPYSSKCDIWSLGAIFYQMMFGRVPYFGNSEYQLIRNIQTQSLKFPSETSKVVKDFISKCMAKDESKRFSWDQLLRHDIFDGYFLKKQQQNKQFQNKYKTLMNNIRQQVKQNQIDLETKFQKLGVGKGSQLSIQKFQKLLKQVDQNLTKQEISYIFNKIAAQNSKSISYQQFQKALQKSGIPMSMIKKQEEVKEPYNGNEGGLYDMLINHIVSPNQNALNGFFKNGFMPQKQQQMGGMNGGNQFNMLQQQQFGGIGGMGGFNLGNRGGMGMMNQMQPMMNFGQLGGYGGGGYGIAGRNGWI